MRKPLAGFSRSDNGLKPCKNFRINAELWLSKLLSGSQENDSEQCRGSHRGFIYLFLYVHRSPCGRKFLHSHSRCRSHLRWFHRDDSLVLLCASCASLWLSIIAFEITGGNRGNGEEAGSPPRFLQSGFIHDSWRRGDQAGLARASAFWSTVCMMDWMDATFASSK